MIIQLTASVSRRFNLVHPPGGDRAERIFATGGGAGKIARESGQRQRDHKLTRPLLLIDACSLRPKYYERDAVAGSQHNRSRRRFRANSSRQIGAANDCDQSIVSRSGHSRNLLNLGQTVQTPLKPRSLTGSGKSAFTYNLRSEKYFPVRRTRTVLARIYR